MQVSLLCVVLLAAASSALEYGVDRSWDQPAVQDSRASALEQLHRLVERLTALELEDQDDATRYVDPPIVNFCLSFKTLKAMINAFQKCYTDATASGRWMSERDGYSDMQSCVYGVGYQYYWGRDSTASCVGKTMLDAPYTALKSCLQPHGFTLRRINDMETSSVKGNRNALIDGAASCIIKFAASVGVTLLGSLG